MTVQANFNANINATFTANISNQGSLSCHGPGRADRSNPTNASTKMEGGKAVFENDNYRITADDNNTVHICNKKTGETYEAWGDPHMKVDGEQAFDFWGKTTFTLEDNTKVTIDTTPFKDNPEMTLSSKVTITNGDYGVQISGVDSNKTGDLKIDEAKGYGRVLDAVVSDGNTVQENPAGKGFVAVDGDGKVRKVDQQYINETDLKKGGKMVDSRAEAFDKLKSLISIAFEGVFLGNHCHRPGRDNGNDRGNDRGNDDRNDYAPRPRHRPNQGGDININIGAININNNSNNTTTNNNTTNNHTERRNTFPFPLPGLHFNAESPLFGSRLELTMGRF